jgi:tetratricopeptide (TPR) repeat protein
MREATALDSGLVDIAREFLVAHQLTRRLFARYRRGELTFEEVDQLVKDGDESVLFRLKERCHALFRARGGPRTALGIPREALFDLAVGSLFHEAMKFRENFYQRAVYGPKVRELRSQSGPEAEELFREFEKILEAAAVRLDEALQETEALLGQTASQFAMLLQAHAGNGLVTRYLLENHSLVEEVFGQDLDAFLSRVYGDAAQAYAEAAWSYLGSGYFSKARAAIDQALERDPDRADLRRLGAYADGMAAYLDGRYREALEHLERWVGAEPGAEESDLASLAHAALGHVPHLVSEAERAAITPAAARLAERLQPLAPVRD